MIKARFRKDAFVFGFSFNRHLKGIPAAWYFTLWFGLIEVDIYAGKFTTKTTGGK